MNTKLEYIWIDGYRNLRSKTKFVNKVISNLDECGEWNYDGSSTGQATGKDSEVIIRPCALYPDPFRKDNHKLILCDTYTMNGEPHITNTRFKANKIFNKNLNLKPMFGIEQEFFLVKNDYPIGFPIDRAFLPKEQKNYYCGVGGSNAIGRECVEKAFDRCIYSGLSVTGLNAEVAPSQWEIQLCDIGIEAADQLTIMRYILCRTAEEYGLDINLEPKPVAGDWNGSGCHVNYSTEPMRGEGGYDVILTAIDKLAHKHKFHMKYYGENNDKRMTGLHETASYDQFTVGVANRGCSVRIPSSTDKNKRGYLEDRRPASNMDPYLVTSLIFETTL